MAFPQFFNNIWIFLGLFCLCFFLETINFTYFISVIQSIERQFQIPSKLAGSLVSAGDIGYTATVIFLAYFGGKGNRARWIAGGFLLVCFACLLVSLPGYIFPAPDLSYLNSTVMLKKLLGYKSIFVSQEKEQKLMRYASGALAFCLPIGNGLKDLIKQAKCSEHQTNTVALGIVFVGIMILGIGHSMPWCLGMPMIDDNVKKHNTPLYFGGVFFIRILGPVLGFIIGASINRVYVTMNAPEGMAPHDPRWIGAWWMGYLAIAVALFIPSLLFAGFKSDIVKKSAIRNRAPEAEATKDAKLINGSAETTQPTSNVQNEVSEFFSAMKAVLKSPVYVCTLIGRLFDAFAFKGWFVFMPKYLEQHYGLPLFKANMFMGFIGVIGFALGVAMGSFILRRFRFTGRQAVVYCATTAIICAGLFFAKIGLGCQSVVSQVGLEGLKVDFNFSYSCNKDCRCESLGMFPACDPDGKLHYSPCIAGCRKLDIIDMKKFDFEFSDCSCLEKKNTTLSRKFCKDDCGVPTIIYFSLMVLSGLIGGSSVIPGVLLVLRSVPVKHRSVALGFSGFLVSLLSTFPSPIVFGYIVDTTCLKWNVGCGGSQGSCEVYDTAALRLRPHLFSGILRCIGISFDIIAWFFAKNVILIDDSEKRVREPEQSEMRELPNLKHTGKTDLDLTMNA